MPNYNSTHIAFHLCSKQGHAIVSVQAESSAVMPPQPGMPRQFVEQRVILCQACGLGLDSIRGRNMLREMGKRKRKSNDSIKHPGTPAAAPVSGGLQNGDAPEDHA